ncbi:hypothetical protein E7V67_007545 [[Empedobacter] haloabium]|uniref:Uncharacterized protein n=1 Tax=[Empedobacter] haloabium TaxID=592317 RepID=A0ABZ1URL4_9BURK
MTIDQRKDQQTALAVAAALDIDLLWGCVKAWRHMRMREVPRHVALRVLSRGGPRRATDARHPGTREDRLRRSMPCISARSPSAPCPRSNVELATIIDQALVLLERHDRHYAEEFLRMHCVGTATIMRVLYDPNRRRSGARRQPASQPEHSGALAP